MIYNIQVRKDKLAHITCPECKHIKTIDVSGFQNSAKKVNVKCVCKAKFTINLEFRNQYRKPTSLDGYYVRYTKCHRKYEKPDRDCEMVTNCSIKNISRDGIGFYKMGRQEVAEGNRIWLQFVLDNSKKSKITREVVVKSVKSDFIGAEFVPRECGIEPELGFYLMSR